MSHHQGKLPDLGYKPTPKVLQLKNNPCHTIGLREQQFPKRMLVNTTTATTGHCTHRGAGHGNVHMARRPCGHTMETASVSSLRKEKDRQLENQKQQNLFPGPNMKQTHVRHDSEQLVPWFCSKECLYHRDWVVFHFQNQTKAKGWKISL